ncbi:MAG TPA: site-2 protease family protein [Planctomycetota bacterium]|nr:site-2 protease family protein [Planctomycetota bacterium]
MEPEKLLIYAQVAIGIGLVIFVHELGHFLAARLCGVRVEVFSLGFGPRLLAWKRGHTTYQLALLPLGGFVRMAGEDRFAGGEPLRPDDLPSKSVGARFLIYSGGVVMNVVFGLVVFPLVLFHGVPFMEPVVGRTQPGGPAWRAGVEPGSRILEINGNPIVSFEYIANEVALGEPDFTRLLVLEPGASEPREVLVVPEYDDVVGLNRIQVLPAFDVEAGVAVQPGSAAEEAGLRDGDRLLAVRGGLPGLALLEQLDAAFQDGGALALTVERPLAGGGGERLEFEFAPRSNEVPGSLALGVSPRFGIVRALRANPLTTELGLREGDRLMEVDGAPIGRPLDLERVLLGEAASRPVRVRVAREGRELESASAGPIAAAQRLDFVRDVALGYDLDSEVVMTTPASAALLAGMLDGDRILRVNGAPVSGWDEVRAAIRAHRGDRPLVLDVERRGEDGRASVVALAATLQPALSTDYGLGFRTRTYVYQATGFGDAVRVGVASSWKFVVDTWLTLKRILFGQVSSENIGGIITIAHVSASWAEEGLAKLLFILCMLSMNLAFINVLPIPVLDGGHLFFLLVEKLKGSPVSERVLGYSQVVGVVLILSLMIYVTYNDLMRWVFTG